MQEWNAVQNVINNNESFALFTHFSADGDALSSAVALALFLKNQGKKTVIFIEEEPQKVLKYITLQDVDVRVYNEGTEYGAFDASIAVDTATEERLGKRQNLFRKAPVTVSIDHHLTKNPYAQLNICDTTWSATCEGIWELMSLYGPVTDKNIAQTIFTGIMTDTGCFAYSNTTENTHNIAAKIIALCGDQSWQYRNIFESVEKSELALRRIAYSKLEFYGNETICFLEITKEDIENSNATMEQLEGFAAFLRTISGVKTAIFVKPGDTPAVRRLSLRSDGDCNVSSVAAGFGGGGHKCASGITYTPEKFDITFEEFKTKLIEEIVSWTE